MWGAGPAHRPQRGLLGAEGGRKPLLPELLSKEELTAKLFTSSLISAGPEAFWKQYAGSSGSQRKQCNTQPQISKGTSPLEKTLTSGVQVVCFFKLRAIKILIHKQESLFSCFRPFVHTGKKQQIPPDHSDTDSALPHQTTKGTRAGGLVDLRVSN